MRLRELFIESSRLLDKPTPTIDDLAEKYHCSLLMVKEKLAIGIKHELEHTSHRKIAREIALDHLGEDLYYYDKLAKAHIDENFADGRNPEHKGDSRRHGIPKKASLATLDKITKQGGRKGQLAHWQANMRRGRAKHK